MRKEYNFANGKRGQFYNPQATKQIPVYLEADVLRFFRAKAKVEGVELDVIINDHLRKEIALLETVK